MASLKPQSKREEFRKYLEKAGVMDALTRVLVGLYEEPERPSNAIEYFLDRLGSGVPLKAELETLQNEVTDLQKKITELEEQNEIFRRRLEEFDNMRTTNNWNDDTTPTGTTPMTEGPLMTDTDT